MSIATRSELITSVGNWLHRDDLAAVIPDFITLVEMRVNRRLRTAEMVSLAQVDTQAGVSTVSVPSDLLELINIEVQGSPNASLQVVTPSILNGKYSSDNQGKPCVFAQIGSDYKLAPTPDAIYTLDVNYYAKVPALTDANTTNWLLTNYPDIYLYGCLVEAKAYIKDQKNLPTWTAALQEGIKELNHLHKEQLFSGSPLVQRKM